MQKTFVHNLLNDDCWKYVFDYLTTRDVVSVGLVCRHWQAVVLQYLKNIQLRIETITGLQDVEAINQNNKCKLLTLNDDLLPLDAVMETYGSSVVELVYNARLADQHILRKLGKDCPNLRDVTFVHLQWPVQKCKWTANFTMLKRICFIKSSIPDSCISELIRNNKIEELVIRKTDYITGRFFVNREGNNTNYVLTHLHTLVLTSCPDFNYKYLVSSVQSANCLTGLRRLELCGLPYNKDEHNVNLILKKMPRLEHLTLSSDGQFWQDVVEAVMGLRCLKYLAKQTSNGTVLRGYECFM